MSNEHLTTRARELARNLSYNDSPLLAATKHTLLELAHRLDSLSARTVNCNKGILGGPGSQRPMTWRERVAYRLFKVLPREV
jgi:hypothetical protein